MRRCDVDYDPMSSMYQNHVCNMILYTSGEVSKVPDFTMKDLMDHLLQNGFTNNTNWIEEEFFPRVER